MRLAFVAAVLASPTLAILQKKDRHVFWHQSRITSICPEDANGEINVDDSGGAGVTIFVVDGGPARLSHDEFAGKGAGMAEYGFMPKGVDVSKPPPTGDTSADNSWHHPTHTSGSAAGLKASFAPKAKLVSIGVSGQRDLNPGLECDPGPAYNGPFVGPNMQLGSSCSYVVEAMKWILSQRDKYAGPMIVSMSRQPRELARSDKYQAVFTALHEANIFLVVSAGNGANIDACKDAFCQYDHVFCVGGTNVQTDRGFVPSTSDEAVKGTSLYDQKPLSAFSSQPEYEAFLANPYRADTAMNDDKGFYSYNGECIDIWSPGKLILSAGHQGDDLYMSGTGTSMATPVAAGAAAYLWGMHKEWDVNTLEAKLKAAALPMMIGGEDKLTSVYPGDYPDNPPLPEACVCWSSAPLTNKPECNVGNFDDVRNILRPCQPSAKVAVNRMLNIAGYAGKDAPTYSPELQAKIDDGTATGEEIKEALGCRANTVHKCPEGCAKTYEDAERMKRKVLFASSKPEPPEPVPCEPEKKAVECPEGCHAIEV